MSARKRFKDTVRRHVRNATMMECQGLYGTRFRSDADCVIAAACKRVRRSQKPRNGRRQCRDEGRTRGLVAEYRRGPRTDSLGRALARECVTRDAANDARSTSGYANCDCAGIVAVSLVVHEGRRKSVHPAHIVFVTGTTSESRVSSWLYTLSLHRYVIGQCQS